MRSSSGLTEASSSRAAAWGRWGVVSHFWLVVGYAAHAAGAADAVAAESWVARAAAAAVGSEWVSQT